MKSLFNSLGLVLVQQISDRDNYRSKAAGWEQKRNIYTPEAIAQKQESEFPYYVERTRINAEQLEKSIHKIKDWVLEQETAWASGDSVKLTNALKIIELSNSMDAFTVKTIREAFRGNIATLRALKSILVAKQGNSLTDENDIRVAQEIGAFDDMIYDPDTAFDSLLQTGKMAFYTGKSLSRFIKDANHIAQLHGVAGMSMQSDESGNNHEAQIAFDIAKPDPEHPDLYGDTFAIEEPQQPDEDETLINKAFGVK